MNHNNPRYALTYYVYERRLEGIITLENTTVHLDGLSITEASQIDGLHDAISHAMQHLKHVTLADPIHGPFTAYRTYQHNGVTVITLFHGLSIADIARQLSAPITLEQAHERVMYNVWKLQDIHQAVQSPLLWNLIPLLPYNIGFGLYKEEMAPSILIDILTTHEQPAMDCLMRDFPHLLPHIQHLTEFLALPFNTPIRDSQEDDGIIINF